MMAQLVSIVWKPKGAQPADGRYTRCPADEAMLVEGYGIEGDAKGGSPGRHLNIMCAANVTSLSADGFHVLPGELGEQLLVDGIDVELLPPGTELEIGEAA